MAEDLTGLPLHQSIQRKLNRMIERGAPPADVMEAALTVAVAGKCGTDGVRDTARQLFVTAAGLAKMADEHEADAAAPRH